jgi:hypothetical protein
MNISAVRNASNIGHYDISAYYPHILPCIAYSSVVDIAGKGWTSFSWMVVYKPGGGAKRAKRISGLQVKSCGSAFRAIWNSSASRSTAALRAHQKKSFGH